MGRGVELVIKLNIEYLCKLPVINWSVITAYRSPDFEICADYRIQLSMSRWCAVGMLSDQKYEIAEEAETIWTEPTNSRFGAWICSRYNGGDGAKMPDACNIAGDCRDCFFASGQESGKRRTFAEGRRKECYNQRLSPSECWLQNRKCSTLTCVSYHPV